MHKYRSVQVKLTPSVNQIPVIYLWGFQEASHPMQQHAWAHSAVGSVGGGHNVIVPEGGETLVRIECRPSVRSGSVTPPFLSAVDRPKCPLAAMLGVCQVLPLRSLP